MTENIYNLVTSALDELNANMEFASLNNLLPETKLYGGNGELDSLALVTLIADLEEKLYDEFGYHMTLANEKAMSGISSPFKKISTLVNYIEQLLEEEKVHE